MIDYFEDEIAVYIVFEYSNIGDVTSYLDIHQNVLKKLDFTKLVIQQTCQALKFCHENKICHRDIKPENVLVFSDLNNNNYPVSFKLCDLGLSECSSIRQSKWSGTRKYMAPEILGLTPYYCDKSDMWAVGIFAYFVHFFRIPFDGDQFRDSEFEEIMKRCNKIQNLFFKDFLLKLLTIDPNKRMTAKQALEHPFLKTFF